MMMPFGSAFAIHNLGISLDNPPILYGVTGVFSILFGPQLGKASDRLGKFNLFLTGTVISSILIAIYTQLGATPFWLLNMVLWMGISSRMISSSALLSGIPVPQDQVLS